MSEIAGVNCDIFFGASKTTKTSQLGNAAEYFYNKTGKPMLLYSADNGGWGPIEHIVEAGKIKAIAVRGLPFAPEAVDKLSQGWIVDGGKVKPAPVGYWDKFSVVAFEGLASFGEWCMDYYALSGQKLGMSQSFTNIKIGDTLYHGVSQDHYGDIQSRLLRCVVNSARIPLVHPSIQKVIWTSLETRGKDDVTQSAILGPTLIGNKKVDKVGQYFGNMIHLDFVDEVVMDQKLKTTIVSARPVMFLRPHQDPQTKLYMPAGTRAPSSFAKDVPAYLDPPDAGKLYQMLDELKVKATAKLASERKDTK